MLFWFAFLRAISAIFVSGVKYLQIHSRLAAPPNPYIGNRFYRSAAEAYLLQSVTTPALQRVSRS
jgi:hypothetical protein